MNYSELEIKKNDLMCEEQPKVSGIAPQQLQKIPNKPTSLLFNKKSQKLIFKPFKHRYSDTGPNRHYTPAVQEWLNSIYTFNKNTIKSIPTADKNIMRLLKTYSNMEFSLKDIKTKYIPVRFKLLSANKTFVGLSSFKHTNEALIITYHVYNPRIMSLSNKLKQVHKSLYYPAKKVNMSVSKDRSGKSIINFDRPFTLGEYLNLPNHYEEWYFAYLLYFVNKLNRYYNNINTWYETLTSLIDKNILKDNEKDLFFNKIANLYTFNYPSYKFYMDKCYWKYTKNLYKHRLLFKLNKVKYNNVFLENLRGLVKNMYNKTIEFNIVNLKKMHLNSDIFTQAVALKLRNRDNKLYKVLKSSLRKLKLQNVNRVRRLKKGKSNKYIVNQIRNDNINSMFTARGYNVKDSLNNLLLEYFPWRDNLKINIASGSNSTISREISLDDYVFSALKHRKMAGIRVEAKGRLTRRFTASRSVFKLKWIGGLKNVDSSFRGLSTIMLRGHVKSNIQYSLLNSKNRNGAFGVKGWVSNK